MTPLKTLLAAALRREQLVSHTPALAPVPNPHGDTKPMSARQLRKQRKAWKRAQKEK